MDAPAMDASANNRDRAAHAPAGLPGLPLTGRVTVPLHMPEADGPVRRRATLAALRGLPSVVEVMDDEGTLDGAPSLTTSSLLALLTDLGHDAHFAGFEAHWTPGHGLILRCKADPAPALQPITASTDEPAGEQVAPPAIESPTGASPAGAPDAAPPAGTDETVARAPQVVEHAPAAEEGIGALPAPMRADPGPGSSTSPAGSTRPAPVTAGTRAGSRATFRRRPSRRVIALVAGFGALVLVGVVSLGMARRHPMQSASGAPVATPSAQPTGAVTPRPTPPAPTPPPLRIQEVPRAFDSVCVMPPDRRPCDEVGQALWDAKLSTWQALALQLGLPLPTADGALADATTLRLQMGDPLARIDIGRAMDLPATFLTTAWLLDAAGKRDLQVEIANLGAAPDDLSGAVITDAHGAAMFTLPAGATLAAGERCRLTTGPAAPAPCAFMPAGPGRAIAVDAVPWPLMLRTAGGEIVDVLAPSAH
jgi:hypothetical protein